MNITVTPNRDERSVIVTEVGTDVIIVKQVILPNRVDLAAAAANGATAIAFGTGLPGSISKHTYREGARYQRELFATFLACKRSPVHGIVATSDRYVEGKVLSPGTDVLARSIEQEANQKHLTIIYLEPASRDFLTNDLAECLRQDQTLTN